MTSTMNDKKIWLERGSAILFALFVWQIAAGFMGEELLLVSPANVFKRLMQLGTELSFWNSIWYSSVRILSGYILALLIGVVFAAFASKVRILDIMLWPFLAAIKATPVASFIILCLIWFPTEHLAIIMSFLMVIPLIYTNTLQGIRQTDKKMLQMAQVFQIKPNNKFLYLYVPSVMPYLLSSCKVAIGLSWKAGIAAEVIGIPNGSIGEMLYQAKIYLNSSDLFAWTVAIVVISILTEKAIVAILIIGMKRLETR